MTNQELKLYMDEQIKELKKYIREDVKALIDKVDPLVIEVAKMQGALSMLKWMVGIGFLIFGAMFTLLKFLQESQTP